MPKRVEAATGTTGSGLKPGEVLITSRKMKAGGLSL